MPLYSTIKFGLDLFNFIIFNIHTLFRLYVFPNPSKKKNIFRDKKKNSFVKFIVQDPCFISI